MQECNPPRNSWLQTHRDDGHWGRSRRPLRLQREEKIPSDDRFAHALKTHLRSRREAASLLFASQCAPVVSAILCKRRSSGYGPGVGENCFWGFSPVPECLNFSGGRGPPQGRSAASPWGAWTAAAAGRID